MLVVVVDEQILTPASCYLVKACLFKCVIISYSSFVGVVGLHVRACTLSALSALGRRRVPCFVKWSLPPSGRVRLSVAGLVFQRQHNWIAELSDIRICNQVTCQLCFPLCHRSSKANRVAICVVLFANWCLFGYMYFGVVESLGIIPGFLYTYCNLGFRLHIPLVFDSFINKGLSAAALALNSKKKKSYNKIICMYVFKLYNL